MTGQIDYYNLTTDDQETWDLLATGKTKGIFQCEGFLGHKYSKMLRPETLEHLSALVSIIRPGVCQAKLNGKSMTDIYCERKNKLIPDTPLLPALEPVLRKNHQLMLYQEDTLAIGQEIAGFDLKTSDKLRKAIGTKDVSIMTKLEDKFVEGCKRVGKVTEEEAKQIFNWIRESQRYSFNHCLAAETTVGGQKDTIRIDSIKPGTYVLAPITNVLEIGSNKRYTKFIEVKSVYIQGKQKLVRVETKNGYSLRCTLNHKLETKDSGIIPLWMIISQDDEIQTINGSSKIQSVEFDMKEGITYDLEVVSDDHLFYANGISVSNSHGIEYGTISYWTSYVKKHYPLEFYTSWLEHSKDKIDPKKEIKELVTDAVANGFYVRIPTLEDIKDGKTGFYIKNDAIVFGLQNIKGVGDKQIEKIRNQILTQNITNWPNFLINNQISSNVLRNLISVGVLDSFKLQRKRMLYEYDIFNKLNLSDKILDNIRQKEYTSVSNMLLDVYHYTGSIKSKQISEFLISLREPPYPLRDTISWMQSQENEILGCNLTDSVVSLVEGDTTCGEFNDGKPGNMSFVVEILDYKETVIKNGPSKGEKMGLGTFKDQTGVISFMIFQEKMKQYRSLFYTGNVLSVYGYRSKKDALVIEVVREHV